MKYVIIVLVLILAVCGDGVAQQAPAPSRPQQNTSGTTQSPPVAPEQNPAEAPPSSNVGATSVSGFPGQRSTNASNDPARLMREISDGLNKGDVHRLEKLAAKGDATAATRVACAYWVGTGVKQNQTTSLSWLSKAAEGGSGSAALLLGTIDAGQSGVPADYEHAEMWLMVAKSAGISLPADAVKTLQQLAGAEKIASGDGLAKTWLASHKLEDDRPRELWARSRSPLPAYKVGPGVNPPKLIHSVDPYHPGPVGSSALVVLQVTIDDNGVPHDVKVVRSGGLDFDDRAVAAVRQWRFQPASKDGHPVAVLVNVEVNFH